MDEARFQIDPEIVAAVAYCRVGHRRPVEDRYFNEAKALGLLAQDSTWRATERGEGLLIACGLLKGEPAPRRTSLAVMWAVCEQYRTPQFVGAWPEYTFEHLDEQEVHDDWGSYGDEHDWRFFTTWEHVDHPKVPEVADVG